jgi:hypothetical protein
MQLEGYNENKKGSKKFLLLLIAGIIVIAVSVFITNSQPDQVLLHKGIVKCKFVRWVDTHSSNDFGLIKMAYQYKNITYINYHKAHHCDYQEMIGKQFDLIIDTLDPNVFHVLIVPKDYRYAGLQFPDSMKWVLTLCDTNFAQ